MSHPVGKKLCTLLPTLLATIAIFLSSYASLSCNFVVFVLSPATFSYEQAGLWSYKWWDHGVGKYTCHAYPESMVIDVWWKVSRGFSLLTLMLGGFALTNIFVVTCCTRCCKSSSSEPMTQWCTRGTVGTCYLASCISTSLSLLFLRSNAAQHNTIFNLVQSHECRLSAGAKCMYAAMGLWFASSSLVVLADEKRNEEVVGEDSPQNSQPLIQDILFECEQSTYSGRDRE